MNVKEVVLLSLFSAAGVLEAASQRDVGSDNNETRVPQVQDKNGECEKSAKDRLLGEIINDELKAEGIDSPFSLGGCLNFTSLYVSQDVKEGKDESESVLEGDIELKYCKKVAEYSFGAELMVKACSGVVKEGKPIVRTSNLFLESDKIGTIKLGYTKTAGELFSICHGKSLVGFCGPDSGNFNIFYNESAGSIVNTGFPHDDYRAAKVVYLSPDISGFTFGLSFTPDSRDVTLFKTQHKEPGKNDMSEEEANRVGMRSAYSKNIITAGMAYEFGDKEGLNAKIAAAGWFGKGKSAVITKDGMPVKVHNVRAYHIGTTIAYKDFEMSLGYTDNGKSLLSKRYADDMVATFNEKEFEGIDEKTDFLHKHSEIGLRPGADAGKIYSIGMAYKFGKLAVSAGYFKSIVKFSDHEKAKADTVTLAAEYTVNKTMSVYAEYDNVSTNTCDRARAYRAALKESPAGKNKANIYMIGTKINL
ncbi:hypothetical protein FACS1894122_03810 [Alphaproteobacteria bacterium]|nr:hypothetical protein FACS1894122_03810 [Alphaproteobacteria bacterium]